MAAARAELIALLEDDCLVEPGWYEVASRSTSQDAAVGGAVEPGPYRRALDWAVYLCEYGRFMLPVPASARGPLTGNNVVYRRKAIAALPDASRSEFREAAVHDGWHRAGVATRVDGALVVRNVNAWSMPAVTASPFHHGRAYAAERFGGRSRLFRATVALLTVAMPAVKLVRLARETLGRGRFAGRMVVALPWILLFFGSWSMGEIVGCVAGSGDSRARWR